MNAHPATPAARAVARDAERHTRRLAGQTPWVEEIPADDAPVFCRNCRGLVEEAKPSDIGHGVIRCGKCRSGELTTVKPAWYAGWRTRVAAHAARVAAAERQARADDAYGCDLDFHADGTVTK